LKLATCVNVPISDQLDLLHKTEANTLAKAINGANKFSQCQKAKMLLNLATYSKSPCHVLDCVKILGSELLKNYANINLQKDTKENLIFDELYLAKLNPEVDRFLLELMHEDFN